MVETSPAQWHNCSKVLTPKPTLSDHNRNQGRLYVAVSQIAFLTFFRWYQASRSKVRRNCRTASCSVVPVYKWCNTSAGDSRCIQPLQDASPMAAYCGYPDNMCHQRMQQKNQPEVRAWSLHRPLSCPRWLCSHSTCTNGRQTQSGSFHQFPALSKYINMGNQPSTHPCHPAKYLEVKDTISGGPFYSEPPTLDTSSGYHDTLSHQPPLTPPIPHLNHPTTPHLNQEPLTSMNTSSHQLPPYSSKSSYKSPYHPSSEPRTTGFHEPTSQPSSCITNMTYFHRTKCPEGGSTMSTADTRCWAPWHKQLGEAWSNGLCMAFHKFIPGRAVIYAYFLLGWYRIWVLQIPRRLYLA